ncbi:MAG: biotin attachment protein [Planctomycetales bacterium]|nr:biotin attachment protein [Planctomycetales bacterium]
MTPIPVTLPDLGASGQPMRVSAWFVDVGDDVGEGERLLEVLVSGITCDVPTPVAGQVIQIEKDLDDQVSPGDILVWIEPADDEDETEI